MGYEQKLFEGTKQGRQANFWLYLVLLVFFVIIFGITVASAVYFNNIRGKSDELDGTGLSIGQANALMGANVAAALFSFLGGAYCAFRVVLGFLKGGQGRADVLSAGAGAQAAYQRARAGAQDAYQRAQYRYQQAGAALGRNPTPNIPQGMQMAAPPGDLGEGMLPTGVVPSRKPLQPSGAGALPTGAGTVPLTSEQVANINQLAETLKDIVAKRGGVFTDVNTGLRCEAVGDSINCGKVTIPKP